MLRSCRCRRSPPRHPPPRVPVNLPSQRAYNDMPMRARARQIAATAATAAAALLAVPPASADKPKTTAIDAKDGIDKVDIYRDDLGNFYIVPRRGAFKDTSDGEKWLFYGDANHLHQQG